MTARPISSHVLNLKCCIADFLLCFSDFLLTGFRRFRDLVLVVLIARHNVAPFNCKEPISVDANLFTDFQFFWCCRKSTNVFRTSSRSCSRASLPKLFERTLTQFAIARRVLTPDGTKPQLEPPRVVARIGQ